MLDFAHCPQRRQEALTSLPCRFWSGTKTARTTNITKTGIYFVTPALVSTITASPS
jgi:hypothetical protein